MPGTIGPVAVQQFFDASGDPLAGAKLYSYVAGTTTPQSIYSDSALTTPLANPAIADSAGRLAYYLTNASYKFVLKTAADVTVWTQDNVAAVPFVNVDLDIPGTAGAALSAGDAVYLSDGSGGLTAGRWYQTDADNAYSSSTAQAVGMVPADIASAASGSIRLQGRITGLSGLTAGSVYYISATAGAITATPPANQRAIGVADSTTSLVIAAGLTPVAATASVAGIVSLSAQTLGAGAKTITTAIFTNPPTGLQLFGRLTANFTKNNSTVLANVTGLAFAVAASEVWAFDFVLMGSSSNVADYAFTLTGPAAPTGVMFGVTTSENAPTTSAASAFGGTIAASGAAGTVQGLRVQGLLRNGANAGTVQLQCAQNTAEATDTIIYADSYVLAWRIS